MRQRIKRGLPEGGGVAGMGPRSAERWGIEPPKNGKERKGQAKVDGSLAPTASRRCT